MKLSSWNSNPAKIFCSKCSRVKTRKVSAGFSSERWRFVNKWPTLSLENCGGFWYSQLNNRKQKKISKWRQTESFLFSLKSQFTNPITIITHAAGKRPEKLLILTDEIHCRYVISKHFFLSPNLYLDFVSWKIPSDSELNYRMTTWKKLFNLIWIRNKY